MSDLDKTSPMRLIIREDFGKNLQRLREHMEFSQGDLANKLNALCHSDYSRTNISKWERGTAFPPLNLIPVLSVALESPLGAFFNQVSVKAHNHPRPEQNSTRGKIEYFKGEFDKDPHAAFNSLQGLLEDTITQLETLQEQYKTLKEKHQTVIKIING